MLLVCFAIGLFAIMLSTENLYADMDNSPTEAQMPLKSHSGASGEVVEATISYYSELDSCHNPTYATGERKCLTASGKIAEVGMVAYNQVPFGTKLLIDGKVYSVEDRTAKRYSDRIDIWVGMGEQAHKQALANGLQHREVKIIK